MAKWRKVRSGRRVLGRFQVIGDGGVLWESNVTKDRGITTSEENAFERIIKNASSGGTVIGFLRQYETSVDP